MATLTRLTHRTQAAWTIIAQLPLSAPPVLVLESDWSTGNRSRECLGKQFCHHAHSNADFVSLGWCSRHPLEHSIPLCMTAYTVTPAAARWLLVHVSSACDWKVPIDWVTALLCATGKLVCEFVRVPTMEGYFGNGYFQQDRRAYGGVPSHAHATPDAALETQTSE